MKKPDKWKTKNCSNCHKHCSLAADTCSHCGHAFGDRRKWKLAHGLPSGGKRLEKTVAKVKNVGNYYSED